MQRRDGLRYDLTCWWRVRFLRMNGSFVTRLLRRDLFWYYRLRLSPDIPAFWRQFWLGMTHVGGARVTIAACLIGMAVPRTRYAGAHTAVALLVAFLFSQIIKRSVSRARPADTVRRHSTLIPPPGSLQLSLRSFGRCDGRGLRCMR